jgi:hypothetical protein
MKMVEVQANHFLDLKREDNGEESPPDGGKVGRAASGEMVGQKRFLGSAGFGPACGSSLDPQTLLTDQG